MPELAIGKNAPEEFIPSWAYHPINIGSAITAIAVTAFGFLNPVIIGAASVIAFAAEAQYRNHPKREALYSTAIVASLAFISVNPLPVLCLSVPFGMIKYSLSEDSKPTLSRVISIVNAFVFGGAFFVGGAYLLANLAESSYPLLLACTIPTMLLTGVLKFYQGFSHVRALAGQFFQAPLLAKYHQLEHEIQNKIGDLSWNEYCIEKGNGKEKKLYEAQVLEEIFDSLPTLHGWELSHTTSRLVDCIFYIVPRLITPKEFIASLPDEAINQFFVNSLITKINYEKKMSDSLYKSVIAYAMNRMDDEQKIQECASCYTNRDGIDWGDCFSFLEKSGEVLNQKFIKGVLGYKLTSISDWFKLDEALLMVERLENEDDVENYLDKIIENVIDDLFDGEIAYKDISISKSLEERFIKRLVQSFLSNVQNAIELCNVVMDRMEGDEEEKKELKFVCEEACHVVKLNLYRCPLFLDVIKDNDCYGELLETYLTNIQQWSVATNGMLSLPDFIEMLPNRAIEHLKKRYLSLHQAVENMDNMIKQIKNLDLQLKNLNDTDKNAFEGVLETYRNIVENKTILAKEKSLWIEEKGGHWHLRKEWIVKFKESELIFCFEYMDGHGHLQKVWITGFKEKDETSELISCYENMQEKAKSSIELFNKLLTEHTTLLLKLQERSKEDNQQESIPFYEYLINTGANQKNYQAFFDMMDTHFSISDDEQDEDLFQHKLSEVDLKTDQDFSKLGIDNKTSNQKIILAIDEYIKKQKIVQTSTKATVFLDQWCGKGWQDNVDLRAALKMQPGDDMQEALSKLGLVTQSDLIKSKCLPTNQELIDMYAKVDTDFAGLYLTNVAAKLKAYKPMPFSLKPLADKVSQYVFFYMNEILPYLPLFSPYSSSLLYANALGFGFGIGFSGTAIYKLKRFLHWRGGESWMPSIFLDVRDRGSPVMMKAFQQASVIERVKMIRNQWLKATAYMSFAPLILGWQSFCLTMRGVCYLASRFSSLKIDEENLDIGFDDKIGKKGYFPIFDFLLTPIS